MDPLRRVRLTFAVLLAVTVAAVGVFGRAVTWPAAPSTGVAVGLSGAVALVAGGLALRVLVALDRASMGRNPPDADDR
ncbi:MAG: hypothetical protein HYX34_00165 [Actinobacteria bacterium]|nr:hypothetical protein [Actinomycetota bacterium]